MHPSAVVGLPCPPRPCGGRSPEYSPRPSRTLGPRRGEVAEWLKAHAWNACMGATPSRVRIPLSPPATLQTLLPYVFRSLNRGYSFCGELKTLQRRRRSARLTRQVRSPTAEAHQRQDGQRVVDCGHGRSTLEEPFGRRPANSRLRTEIIEANLRPLSRRGEGFKSPTAAARKTGARLAGAKAAFAASPAARRNS